MKLLAVKIDESLDAILRKRAEGRKITFGRYIRSLIEKGMVVENQLEQGHYADTPDKNKTMFDIRHFEMTAESTVLIRKLVEWVAKTERESKSFIADAEERSKTYARKVLDKDTI